jgi:hypothetical protein
MVQEPINVMLGSISDLNTVILPINEMFLNLDSFKSLENELTKNIPAFYKEILETWIICGGEDKIPENFREIRKQIIWGNKYIKFYL